MDMCMNSNLFVISSGPYGSSESVLDGLVSQYSNYWACYVKPLLSTPHLFCLMFFCMVHGMFCVSFLASIWWLSSCILRTSILAIVQLRMPEIEDRYSDLLQQQKSNYVQRCVCLCVRVFEASLTSQEGLWPVRLLWWWHTEMRGVLRSVFKYYLFLSLVLYSVSHVFHVTWNNHTSLWSHVTC